MDIWGTIFVGMRVETLTLHELQSLVILLEKKCDAIEPIDYKKNWNDEKDREYLCSQCRDNLEFIADNENDEFPIEIIEINNVTYIGIYPYNTYDDDGYSLDDLKTNITRMNLLFKECDISASIEIYSFVN